MSEYALKCNKCIKQCKKVCHIFPLSSESLSTGMLHNGESIGFIFCIGGIELSASNVAAATVSSMAGHLTEVDRGVPRARGTQRSPARPARSWQL